MATKPFNFKTPLLDAEDQPIKENTQEVHLSKILCDVIMNSVITEAPLKYFDWALELKKSGTLQLDDTDKDTLVKFITSSPNLPMITKGRLLKVLIK